MRKFKQWLDAEYTVVGTENSRMRLAVKSVYGEYEALANICIEHKGTRVSVGSGFTAEQRIRYGQRPEDIVSTPCAICRFGRLSLTPLADRQRSYSRVLLRISFHRSRGHVITFPACQANLGGRPTDCVRG